MHPAMSKLPGPPLWAPASARGAGGKSVGRGSGGAAARLQAALPTLQRSPAQLRTLLVHAVDLQREIDTLEPRPGLTGRWRKCK